MSVSLKNLLVKDIMSTQVETLIPDDDLDLAAMLMRLDRIRHLPVLENGQLVGVVSQRDIARHKTSPSSGLSTEDQRIADLRIKIRDIMVHDVITTTPDTPLIDAVKKMRRHHLGCLPVIENDHMGNELVGILTESDLLDLFLKTLEDLAE